PRRRKDPIPVDALPPGQSLHHPDHRSKSQRPRRRQQIRPPHRRRPVTRWRRRSPPPAHRASEASASPVAALFFVFSPRLRDEYQEMSGSTGGSLLPRRKLSTDTSAAGE